MQTCASGGLFVRLNIRSKVVAFVGSLFIALGIAQLFVDYRILLPSFSQLERQNAETDMDRVALQLARDQELLRATTLDWGDWDATYQFMHDHNSKFIATNITTSALQGYQANAIAFVDLKGKFVWATAIAPRSGEPIDLDLIAHGELPFQEVWRNAVQTGHTVSGLLRTNRGAMLIALAPVLNGTQSDPHNGMILLGRLLTDKEIARMGQLAHVQLMVDILPPSAHQTPVTQSLKVGKDSTEVFRVLTDVAGAPLLALHVSAPRQISKQGQAVVTYASIFLLATGGIALVLLVLVLNRTVLSPLAIMTDHAVRLGHSNDLTSRLELSRSDELGALGKEFDRMVGRLSDARRQLVDRSFEAGVAENASGVLHNLGNAMTPLCVKVTALQDTLREAPIADIDLVLTEIEQANPETQRRADLERFLRLTSRELADRVADLKENVDAVARNTYAIQAVLNDQIQRSRSTRPLETVQLGELLHQSVELVAPELRDRLTIDLEGSLSSPWPVTLSRVTVQQIFQNLIVNAAEAVRETTSNRGMLRISAEIGGSEPSKHLHLRFADNGGGIAEEHLSHIFERGFSTKPSTANSGIGLHWSANAVNALGGSLRVESAKTNGGAVFLLVLPLVRAADVPLTKAA